MSKAVNLRTFYLIIITQTISLIGSRMTSFALGIWIDLAHAAQLAALMGALPLALGLALFSLLPPCGSSSLGRLTPKKSGRRES